jgi:hypothetical protein
VDSKEVRHVLHQDVTGSKLANGSGHLSPQNSLGMVEPVPFPSGRGSLAGEPAGDEVDGVAAIPDVSNIAMDSCPGPPLGEEVAPELVGLAEPGVVDPGEVEAVVEEAGAREDGATDHDLSAASSAVLAASR